MPTFHIGTSGWQYDWRGTFYPDGLPQRRWLEFYASHFETVEVNNSFHRLPEFDSFRRWRTRPRRGSSLRSRRDGSSPT